MKLAALLLGLALSARAEVRNPDTFTYVTVADIDGLDPAFVYDSASQMVVANIYEYLLAFKGSSIREMEPRLATQVPSVSNGLISKDGLTYTFPIRSEVKFHDGRTMTPEDVRYSLIRFMLQDRAGGPSSLLLEPILGVSSTRDAQGEVLPDIWERAQKAVEVKGDRVVIHLAKPFAPFLTILVQFGAVVSKGWCIEHGDWNGDKATFVAHNNPNRNNTPLMDLSNGTGPFKVGRWDKRNREIVLERFDDYWRKPARLRRVVIKSVDEFATRKLMLQAGDADSIYVPQGLFAQVQGLEGVQLIDHLRNLEAPMSIGFTFHLNPAGNPNIGSGRLDGDGIPPDFFADKEIRLAFASAIDYDGFINGVMSGRVEKAGSIIPRGLLGYDPKFPTRRFDLKEAEAHFKKARNGEIWNRGFHLTLVFTTGVAPFQSLFEMMKRNIESLNPKFAIDVRPIQWSTFLEQSQARKIPIFAELWNADYPDPHNFVAPILQTGGYFPSKQDYSNPEIDRLIAQAASTLDTTKREALYRRIQRIGYEEIPYAPVYGVLRFRAQRSWVKGYVFNPVFPDAPYADYYYNLSKE